MRTPHETLCDSCRTDAVSCCQQCGTPLCVDCAYENEQYWRYEAIDRPDCSAAFTPHCEPEHDPMPDEEITMHTDSLCPYRRPGDTARECWSGNCYLAAYELLEAMRSKKEPRFDPQTIRPYRASWRYWFRWIWSVRWLWS